MSRPSLSKAERLPSPYKEQATLAYDWKLADNEHLDDSAALALWTDSFAWAFRDLLDHGISAGDARITIGKLQDVTTEHFQNLKWYLSEREGSSVSLERTVNSISSRAVTVSVGGVRQHIIELMFPNLEHPEEPYVLSVRTALPEEVSLAA